MFIKVDYREKDLQDKLSYYISFIPAFRNLKVISEIYTYWRCNLKVLLFQHNMKIDQMLDMNFYYMVDHF